MLCIRGTSHGPVSISLSVCLSVTSRCSTKMAKRRITDWMASNRLKLNEDKTRIIWLGTQHQLNKTLPQMLTLQNGTVLQFSTAVKNLGVLIDSQLTMADHIAAVCRSGFFQLRQLRSIRQSLTPAAVKTLVHAFISSRLDYCNQLVCWCYWSAAG